MTKLPLWTVLLRDLTILPEPSTAPVPPPLQALRSDLMSAVTNMGVDAMPLLDAVRLCDVVRLAHQLGKYNAARPENSVDDADDTSANLKIHVGGYYITRDGTRVGPLLSNKNPIFIYKTMSDERTEHCWTEYGSYWSNRQLSPLDLVSEATAYTRKQSAT